MLPLVHIWETRRRQHIIKFRIKVKILLVIYNANHCQAPTYIEELLAPGPRWGRRALINHSVENIILGGRSLKLSGSSTLKPPADFFLSQTVNVKLTVPPHDQKATWFFFLLSFTWLCRSFSVALMAVYHILHRHSVLGVFESMLHLCQNEQDQVLKWQQTMQH